VRVGKVLWEMRFVAWKNACKLWINKSELRETIYAWLFSPSKNPSFRQAAPIQNPSTPMIAIPGQHLLCYPRPTKQFQIELAIKNLFDFDQTNLS